MDARMPLNDRVAAKPSRHSRSPRVRRIVVKRKRHAVIPVAMECTSAGVGYNSHMSFLGNVIWFVLGGFIPFFVYVLGGLLLCLTIVGIPFGIAFMRLGFATAAPFGKQVIERANANSLGRLLLNILWIFTFGWTIALNHLFWACVFAVTIVGIPFAVQHLKLIPLSLLPFGRDLQ